MSTIRTTRPSTIVARLVVAVAIFTAGMGAAIVIDADPSAAHHSDSHDRAGLMLTDGRADLRGFDLRGHTHFRHVDPPAGTGPTIPDPSEHTPTRPETDDDDGRLVLVVPPAKGDGTGIAIDAPLKAFPECPGSGALPAGATNHSLSGADVDGDGDVDTLHGYVVDGQGYVQISFAGGGGSSVAVDPGFAPMVAPRPSDGHDLDGDGDEEFTVRIAGGVGGFTHALFEVDGCTLERVTVDDEPLELHHRETIGARSGFMCTHEEGNHFLHVWDLVLLDPEVLDEPQDADVYGGLRSMYRLIDGELVLQGVSEAYEIPGEYELGNSSACPNLLPA